MIPQHQKRDWDCHMACVASILEVPLERMPQIDPDKDALDWHEEWQEWFAKQGLVSYDIEFKDSWKKVKGYTIGCVDSQKQIGRHHSIVCLNGRPVFDPMESNERTYEPEDVEVHTLIVPINPAVLINANSEVWK